MKCQLCGDTMRHNVPRLGDSGGFVHDKTSQYQCGPRIELSVSIHCSECDKLMTLAKRMENHLLHCGHDETTSSSIRDFRKYLKEQTK